MLYMNVRRDLEVHHSWRRSDAGPYISSQGGPSIFSGNGLYLRGYTTILSLSANGNKRIRMA